MKVPEPRRLPSGNYNIHMVLSGVSVSVTRATYKECKDDATLIKAEHRAKKRVITQKAKTLTEAIDKYISKRSDVLSPSTVRGYRVTQNNYFQNVMNSPLDKADWQKEVNAMARDYAPATVKNAWRFVASVLKENGVVAPNITLPKKTAQEREFLSPEQIKVFVEVVDGEVKIPALLALHSLRRSEIAGLDWKNIDLKKKTITVSGAVVPDEDGKLVYKKTNKTDSSARTIPIMIPALYDALSAVEDKTGAVCKMHPNSIYKAVNSVCAANGLPLVGVHGLRHSFASLAYSIGLSEKQTMELGGWSDFGTMRKIYTHLDEKSKEDARKKMEQFFTPKNKKSQRKSQRN